MIQLKRSRNFTITLNNYPRKWKETITKLKDLRYLIAGEEVAPTTGTRHLQGFIQFKQQTSLKQTIKRFAKLGMVPHIEIANGSVQQNIDYCSKSDKDAFTWGEKKTERQRTDLVKLRDKIKSGELKTKKDVIDSEFDLYCRYRGGIKDAIQEYSIDRAQEFRNVDVEYVFGPTGTGKTRYLHEHKDLFAINGSDMKWFDGYRGQTCLGIDEYDSNVACSDLLSLLDGYTKRLPVKGGFTYAMWTKVIITSNIHPSDLHRKAKDEHRRALWRRVNRIIEVPRIDEKIVHQKEKFDKLCYDAVVHIGFD